MQQLKEKLVLVPFAEWPQHSGQPVAQSPEPAEPVEPSREIAMPGDPPGGSGRGTGSPPGLPVGYWRIAGLAAACSHQVPPSWRQLVADPEENPPGLRTFRSSHLAAHARRESPPDSGNRLGDGRAARSGPATGLGSSLSGADQCPAHVGDVSYPEDAGDREVTEVPGARWAQARSPGCWLSPDRGCAGQRGPLLTDGGSCGGGGTQVAVHQGDGGGALADGGGDPFDRFVAHVPGGEHPGQAGF